jgi:salicylate hydroxylase
MRQQPPIVIIGAGIGGLSLALLLRQRGVPAMVLEQTGQLREVGAAIALGANGTRILHHLGLADALARAGTEPTRLIHRDGLEGRVVTTTPGPGWYRTAFGAPFYGLHRRALQELLAAAAGAEHLRLGCQASALARDWVTGGDDPVYSGTSGFRGLVPAELLPSLPEPGALQFWMGPGAHLLHYPISDGQIINFLAVVDGPARWTAPGWMQDAEPGEHRSPFTGWHPAVTEMLTAVPQSPRWGLFARRPLIRWHRGPVVLLGDAAHAMLPHHGQGANQTIEDAAVLAGELASVSSRAGELDAALRRYTERRRVRTRQVQLASWAASAALHQPAGPATAARDAYLAEAPDRLAWIHGYDALA